MKRLWLLSREKNFRALSLILCTLCYLILGATVFDALESGMDDQKRHLLAELSARLRKKYNISDDDFRVLQTVIVRSIPQKAGCQWKFVGAFYFAVVVITTIGYGHSTPNTKLGKTFCMFYAICGVPLNIVMFQCIGERLNTLIAHLLYVLKASFRVKRFKVTHSHVILVSMSLGIIVIILGAYMFHKYESWTFFDSFYYCFITLSTIGFGDFVAIQNNYALEQNYEYIALSLLFIVFGLALFSASVNLFVLHFMVSKAEQMKGPLHPLMPTLPRTTKCKSSEQPIGVRTSHDNSPLASLACRIALPASPILKSVRRSASAAGLQPSSRRSMSQSNFTELETHCSFQHDSDIWQMRKPSILLSSC